MEPWCILLANEPRSYREVIAGALRQQRPRWPIADVEPEVLPAHLGRCAREFVIASQLSEPVRQRAFGWVLLYPDFEDRATIGFAGHETTVEGLDFDGLLAVLDRAETVALAAGQPTDVPHEQPPAA
jgi:hypothetical protein